MDDLMQRCVPKGRIDDVLLEEPPERNLHVPEEPGIGDVRYEAPPIRLQWVFEGSLRTILGKVWCSGLVVELLVCWSWDFFFSQWVLLLELFPDGRIMGVATSFREGSPRSLSRLTFGEKFQATLDISCLSFLFGRFSIWLRDFSQEFRCCYCLRWWRLSRRGWLWGLRGWLDRCWRHSWRPRWRHWWMVWTLCLSWSA